MVFSTLATYFQKLENTPSRITMTEILADLFSSASTTEIGEICFLLQGRVAPLFEPVEFGVADKLMIRAITSAYSLKEAQVIALFKKYGDLGITAETIAKEKHPSDKHTSTSVHSVFIKLQQLAGEKGAGSQERKNAILSELLSACDPLSARYLVRIPLDKLRLGFSDMTMLDALSWMITKDKSNRSAFEAAYNVRPDLSFIATLIKTRGLAGVSGISTKVGAPILAALCQRLPNAKEMIEKMGEVDVEPKYDGVRTQIHFIKHPSWVQSYSRNLENTTAMYPELTHIASQIDADEVILDSEAVGYDEIHKRVIPFQETVTRKRKYGIREASATVPLRFFVFDILSKNGKDLMGTPLSKRRVILEKTIRTGRILSLSPHIVTSDIATLREYQKEQIALGLEGVVVKKWDSHYEPGRRGYTWVKFKEEGKVGKLADTIDCVVMGYYKGEGKRADFGIGAFLVGVLDKENFVTVTKIGTGVSDELWKMLAKRFAKERMAQKPSMYGDVEKSLTPDVWVQPTTVVEIAADDITKSPIHKAGYALRFPRLVRIREDKSIHAITSTKELQTMYSNQQSIRL